MIQPFNSLSQCFLAFRLPLPRKGDWRLANPIQGEVNALPSLRGTLLATDGIMALIVTEDRKPLFVHFEWFKRDRQEGQASKQKEAKKLDINQFI